MTNALEEFKDVNDARIFAENIIATVREPLLVLDGELRVVFANEAFYAKFQVARKESEGTLIYELGNGQWNIPKLREALEKIIPHESHFDDYEVEHSFPQIGQKIMLLNGRQVQQAGERKKFILLAIEDVTDRIMTKRKLQESEKKFRGFIQTINSIILRFNSEGKITFFNHFSEQLFGYSEKELLGKPMVGTIIPEKDEEDRDQQAMVQGAIEHPEQYYFKQTEGRKKNGGKVWFQWSAKETRDEYGKVTEILIDGNDITGEMEYRRMLQEVQGLAESSPDIMARFDHDMRLAYGNPLFIRLLGRSRSEVIGKTVRELGLSEETATQLVDAFQKVKGEQDHLKTVIEVQGHFYHVQVVAEDEQRQSYKVYAADITDRKKIEEELAAARQKSEKRAKEAEQGRNILDALMQFVPVELQIIDRNSTILWDSRFSEKMTGHPVEEVEGLSLEKRNKMIPFYRPDGVTIARVDELPATRVLKTGEAVMNETWKVKTVEGRFVDVSINSGPVKDSKGVVTGAVTTWHDITDIKKAEETLRRNEYELKSVVENTPDIYFRMNRQQQYVYVNPTYERLTGLTKEQFIGKTNSQLGMSRQMVQFWQSAVQEAFESGKEHTVEFENTSFFGKRYFSARTIPEFEKSGLVETVLVIARDITDKKHVEEEVASLKK